MRLSRLLAKEGNRCELWRRWAKKSDSPVAGKAQADQCLANEHHPKIGRTWGSKAGSVSLEITQVAKCVHGCRWNLNARCKSGHLVRPSRVGKRAALDATGGQGISSM